jgi:cytochrome c oxidase subunit 4
MKEVRSIRHYTLILAALLALLALTVGAALIRMGAFSTPVALGIAAAKAVLVALFFMHLQRSTGLTRLVACVGLFWLGILFVLSLNDYLTRH